MIPHQLFVVEKSNRIRIERESIRFSVKHIRLDKILDIREILRSLIAENTGYIRYEIERCKVLHINVVDKSRVGENQTAGNVNFIAVIEVIFRFPFRFDGYIRTRFHIRIYCLL